MRIKIPLPWKATKYHCAWDSLVTYWRALYIHIRKSDLGYVEIRAGVGFNGL